jgi:hypothetical protein
MREPEESDDGLPADDFTTLAPSVYLQRIDRQLKELLLLLRSEREEQAIRRRHAWRLAEILIVGGCLAIWLGSLLR